MLLMFAIALSIGSHYGIGKYYVHVDPYEYPKAVMWDSIGTTICILAAAASKGSVALLLLRIVLQKWHKAVLWFCIILTTIMSISTASLFLLHCRPTAYLWDPVIDGICWLTFEPIAITWGGEYFP